MFIHFLFVIAHLHATSAVLISYSFSLLQTQLPGSIYNFEKNCDGYVDENQYDEPYRHITNWFLTKNGKVNQMRCPLPFETSGINKINRLTLYGEVQPCERHKTQPTQKIKLEGLRQWYVSFIVFPKINHVHNL